MFLQCRYAAKYGSASMNHRADLGFFCKSYSKVFVLQVLCGLTTLISSTPNSPELYTNTLMYD